MRASGSIALSNGCTLAFTAIVAPGAPFRLDPEHLGVRPARGTRVHGSSRLVKWLHGKRPIPYPPVRGPS